MQDTADPTTVAEAALEVLDETPDTGDDSPAFPFPSEPGSEAEALAYITVGLAWLYTAYQPAGRAARRDIARRAVAVADRHMTRTTTDAP